MTVALSAGAVAEAPADGRRRAAIALVALGPERAAAVMRGMSEEEVRLLAGEVLRLGTVSAGEVRGTMTELARGLSGPGSLPAPGAGFAADMLRRALGDERGNAMVAELDVPPPFAWLAKADAVPAAEALAVEPPAAVALALAHLEPVAAARLLVNLPDAVRAAVATRIASLGAVHPETLRQVEEGLRARVQDVLDARVTKLQGPALLADLLSKAGRETSRELLAILAETSPELADATREALFTFDDVCEMNPKTLQVLLRGVDGKELAIALSAASPAVRDRVLVNLSERARETILEEIELSTGLRKQQVEDARNAVVATARRMEEEGTLVLVRAGDEE